DCLQSFFVDCCLGTLPVNLESFVRCDKIHHRNPVPRTLEQAKENTQPLESFQMPGFTEPADEESVAGRSENPTFLPQRLACAQNRFRVCLFTCWGFFSCIGKVHSLTLAPVHCPGEELLDFPDEFHQPVTGKPVATSPSDETLHCREVPGTCRLLI